MSEHNDDYSRNEIIEMIDDASVVIIQGMLVWMDMAESLIEDEEHNEHCDGKCSIGAIDDMFRINHAHLNRVVESFRISLTDIASIKDELTSDASKEADNE